MATGGPQPVYYVKLTRLSCGKSPTATQLRDSLIEYLQKPNFGCRVTEFAWAPGETAVTAIAGITGISKTKFRKLFGKNRAHALKSSQLEFSINDATKSEIASIHKNPSLETRSPQQQAPKPGTSSPWKQNDTDLSSESSISESSFPPLPHSSNTKIQAKSPPGKVPEKLTQHKYADIAASAPQSMPNSVEGHQQISRNHQGPLSDKSGYTTSILQESGSTQLPSATCEAMVTPGRMGPENSDVVSAVSGVQLSTHELSHIPLADIAPSSSFGPQFEPTHMHFPVQHPVTFVPPVTPEYSTSLGSSPSMFLSSPPEYNIQRQSIYSTGPASYSPIYSPHPAFIDPSSPYARAFLEGYSGCNVELPPAIEVNPLTSVPNSNPSYTARTQHTVLTDSGHTLFPALVQQAAESSPARQTSNSVHQSYPLPSSPSHQNLPTTMPSTSTVKVENLGKKVSRKWLEDFFGSSEQKGGEIAHTSVIGRTAYITYKRSQVAAEVASQGQFTVDDRVLTVSLLKRRPDPLDAKLKTFNHNLALVLSNIPRSVCTEHLEAHIDAETGLRAEQHYKLRHHEDMLALVAVRASNSDFLRPLYDALSNSSRPLKKARGPHEPDVHLKVSRLDPVDSIYVSNLDKDYQFVECYFSKAKKSGGGDLKRFRMISVSQALVSFQQCGVVETVLDCDHTSALGLDVKVQLYQPILSRLFRIPDVDIPDDHADEGSMVVHHDPILHGLKPHLYEHIREHSKVKENLRACLNKVHASTEMIDEEDGKGLLVRPQLGSKRMADWSTTVQAKISEFLNKFSTIVIPEDLMGAMSGPLQELLRMCDITVSSSPGSDEVVLVCAEEDMGYVEPIVKDVISKNLNTCMEVPLSLDTVFLLKNCQVSRNRLKKKHKVVLEHFDIEKCSLEVRGKANSCEDFVADMKSFRCVSLRVKVHEIIVRFYATKRGMHALDQAVKNPEVTYLFKSAQGGIISDPSSSLLTQPAAVSLHLLGLNHRALAESRTHIEGYLVESEVPVPREFHRMIGDEKASCSWLWNRMKENFSSSYLCNLVPIQGSVQVVCEEQSLPVIVKEIKSVVEKCCYKSATLRIPHGIWKYILKYSKGWADMYSRLHKEGIRHSIPEQNDDMPIIALKGELTPVNRWVAAFQNLQGKVKNHVVQSSFPGVSVFFLSKEGRNQLEGIGAKHSAVIDMCTTPNHTDQMSTSGDIDQQLVCKASTGYVKIEVVVGDLTEFSADVIVNAANIRLEHAGGLAGALVNKGGRVIQEESREYVKTHGCLSVGDAVMLKQCGRLPCKAVVHAVGPRWAGGNNDEESLLRKAVRESLSVCAGNLYQTIAFPAIGAGIFQVPHKVCAHNMIQAIYEFVKCNSSCTIRKVYIVLMQLEVIESFWFAVRNLLGTTAEILLNRAELTKYFNERQKWFQKNSASLQGNDLQLLPFSDSSLESVEHCNMLSGPLKALEHMSDSIDISFIMDLNEELDKTRECDAGATSLQGETPLPGTSVQQGHGEEDQGSISPGELTFGVVTKELSETSADSILPQAKSSGTPEDGAQNEEEENQCQNEISVKSEQVLTDWTVPKKEIQPTPDTSLFCKISQNQMSESVEEYASGQDDNENDDNVESDSDNDDAKSNADSDSEKTPLESCSVHDTVPNSTASAVSREVIAKRSTVKKEPMPISEVIEHEAKSPASPIDTSSTLSDSLSTSAKLHQTQPWTVPMVKFGSLFDYSADAYVNSANIKLDLSRGAMSRSLLAHGGAALQNKCDEYVTRNGYVQEGAVVVMANPSQSLSCQYVLHCVVRPYDGPGGQAEQVLASIVSMVLKQCDLYHLNSVAFPALGTGNLHFPPDVSAKVIHTAMAQHFIGGGIASTAPRDVKVVVMDRAAHTIFQQQFSVIPSPQSYQLATQPVKAQPTRPHRNAAYSTHVMSIFVEVVKADITSDNSDAIIASNSSDMLRPGGVMGALITKGGSMLLKECQVRKATKGSLVSGKVIVTHSGQPGQLKCKHIIHIPIPKSPSELESSVFQAMRTAEQQLVHSVSLPAIGAGSGLISLDQSAQAICNAIEKLSSSKPLQHLGQIRIVVISNDHATAFKKVLQRVSANSVPPLPSAAWMSQQSNGVGPAPSLPVPVYVEPGLSVTIYSADSKALQDAAKEVETSVKNSCAREVIKTTLTLPENALDTLKKTALNLSVELCLAKSGAITMKGNKVNVAQVKNSVQDCLHGLERVESRRKEADALVSKIQWKWKDPNEPVGALHDYDPLTNLELEQAYLNQAKQCTVRVDRKGLGPKESTVDLKALVERSAGCSYNIERTLIESSAEGSKDEFPSYWSPMPHDVDGKEMPCDSVELKSYSEEYRSVASQFNQDIDPPQKRTTVPVPYLYRSSFIHTVATSVPRTVTGRWDIVKIERVQNPTLYLQYAARRRAMKKTLGESTASKFEMQLFHGCDDNAAEKIKAGNFNRSYAGKNATVYGKGVYFASQAKISAWDTYSRPDLYERKRMYLARVLVGDYTQGAPSMLEPPAKQYGSAAKFDSVVNDTISPTIFVIFSDPQAYPEYLIHFKAVYDS